MHKSVDFSIAQESDLPPEFSDFETRSLGEWCIVTDLGLDRISKGWSHASKRAVLSSLSSTGSEGTVAASSGFILGPNKMPVCDRMMHLCTYAHISTCAAAARARVVISRSFS